MIWIITISTVTSQPNLFCGIQTCESKRLLDTSSCRDILINMSEMELLIHNILSGLIFFPSILKWSINGAIVHPGGQPKKQTKTLETPQSPRTHHRFLRFFHHLYSIHQQILVVLSINNSQYIISVCSDTVFVLITDISCLSVVTDPWLSSCFCCCSSVTCFVLINQSGL